MNEEKKPVPVSPWKGDFPMLDQTVHQNPLIYLDNAATTQMPEAAIGRLGAHYRCRHANVHRGSYSLGNAATARMEEVRALVRDFLHAEKEEEIIFTCGTTDSIAIAANGIRAQLKPGMAVLSTQLEHHSNYVPWQQICRQMGADFKVVPMNADGDLDLAVLEKMLKEQQVFLLAVTQVSNSTGTAVDLKEVTALAHRYGAQILVDGAQGVRHSVIDVQELDCDYYCFSAHKMMGPTGLGVLYGKEELLNKLTPLRFGGGMVEDVGQKDTTFAALPYRLEGGTPPIAEIDAFGESLSYFNEIGIKTIAQYEDELLEYLKRRLSEIEGIELLGDPKYRAGLVSFYSKTIHSYDIAAFLDQQGAAVRSGSLCAQPALHAFGIRSVVRVSPAFYNGREDIDRFFDALLKTISFFGKFA